MRKKFFKYSLIAVVITYTALFINIKYGLKYNKQFSSNGEKTNRVSANVIKSNENKNFQVVSDGAFFTPCFNFEGNKLLYSSGDEIYEMDLIKKDTRQLTVIGNCYNPVYNEKDNNVIAFARNNGIFIMDIKKKDTRKLVGSNNPETSFAKPNFTPEGDIIYFSVTVYPREDGHGFIETNPSIYKISKDGKINEKIVDGYNPVLSKDGNSLLYESGENIYLMNLKDKSSKLIDSGKYASFSNSGRFISYAKFERGIEKYLKSKFTKRLYIDKEFSNIFIANIDNLKNKNKITKEEFEDKDYEIKNWANDIKESTAEQHFLLVSKFAYFDSVWSKNDDELYISIYDGDKGEFRLIKYDVNN